jgi:hypothetical protein
MAISTALLMGVLALGPGNPLGAMPAYLDAMEAGALGERAEAQVVEALSRHAQSFAEVKRLARGAGRGAAIPKITQIHIEGDKATAVLTTSDRAEFVQLVRSNHKWLVVPPQRERVDF